MVDNIVVKTFFDEAIKYYHPENCLLSKSHTPKTTGTKRALNQEELFDLFKKILVPLPPIKQSELSELTDIFNSNFTSDNFSEVLLEEFDWDEIYEDLGMHDVDIKQRIKQELEKLL